MPATIFFIQLLLSISQMTRAQAEHPAQRVFAVKKVVLQGAQGMQPCQRQYRHCHPVMYLPGPISLAQQPPSAEPWPPEHDGLRCSSSAWRMLPVTFAKIIHRLGDRKSANTGFNRSDNSI